MANGTKASKPVVMMQHGLADSSDSWILNYRDKAPALVAATEGYDVWVLNHRGNKHTRLHKTLDHKTDFEYWDHSFIELAKYDMPAFIEHIKESSEMAER